jgi:phosphoglycolate phosphatase-like HAD superfamily hydrolase
MYQNRKHWVFDLDGTLTDTFPFYLRLVHQILGEHGITLSTEETIYCLGQNATSYFTKQLGPDAAKIAMERILSQTLIDIPEIKTFPGIIDLLTLLKNQGHRISIWTSRDKHTAELVLQNTGIDQFIETFVSGCCVAKHKPDTEGLEKIATHFKCKASELIMVGDNEIDVLAARTAGAHGIRASWHGFEAPVSCEIANELYTDVADLRAKITNQFKNSN